MSDTINRIEHEGVLAAIIVRAAHQSEGIDFLTPNDFSQQLAYMHRPAGYHIPPHVHNKVTREVFFTQEALFIRKGRLQVDFYDAECKAFDQCVLESGDVILLASGGHGFTMLEDTEMIEVKQGPYAGDADKTRFTPA